MKLCESYNYLRRQFNKEGIHDTDNTSTINKTTTLTDFLKGILWNK